MQGDCPGCSSELAAGAADGVLRCAHCAGTFVPRPLLESFLATVPAEAADSA
ncbi:MAG: zf-TFIIB domain-containing protein, partial [Anaerolineae bacterium]|nr:zf-TFIIB domain-containing protein [Anaerolineae bacterium]